MRIMISLALIGAVLFVVGIIGMFSVEMFSAGYGIFGVLLISGFLTTFMNAVPALVIHFIYDKE